MFDPDRPYNDLPNLPPSRDVETPAVLKLAIRSSRALAELGAHVQMVPNAGLLLDTLQLQEARASSEVENIITTNDNLFRAMASKGKGADPHTKEVLRYSEALKGGWSHLQEKGLLTTRLFEDICSWLLKVETHVRRQSGTRLLNTQTGKITYTPPEGEKRLRDLLHKLEEFIHAKDDMDPLIKMALIHYQFEAIHPFTDGNGRTGRILNILYLVQQELLDLPVLYLSRYFIENREAYYQHLRDVTQNGAWEAWVLYVLRGVEETAVFGLRQIAEIETLFDMYIERARKKAPHPRITDMMWLIFRRPFAQISFFMDELNVSRATATRYLRALAGIGLLTETKSRGEVVFVNEGLLRILSDDEGV